MYFKFPCPQCNKSLKVSDDKAGKKARCPYCHHSVTVPEPDAPPEDDRAAVMSELLGELSPPGDSEEPSGGAQELPGQAPAAGKKEKRKKEKEKRGDVGASGEQFAQGTEVSLWWTGLWGLIGTAWFYGLVWLMYSGMGIKSFYFELFLARGAIPYWETFFMLWGTSIVLAKWHKYRRQKESMLFDVLPTELGAEITPENVDKFIEHVRGLPASPGDSFLVNRVLRGLLHFKTRRSNAEVATQLSSQSDIDASAVYSSYTMVKVFVWAIPILGFIGTVVGMSAAVGAFSGAMDSAGDIAQLKLSLNKVTTGLGVAFDTTYVALVMAMLLTLPQNSLQKGEEDLLNWVDEYCNENLIKRLNDGGGQATPRDHSPSGVAERIAAIQKDLAKVQESHVASLKGATALIDGHLRTVQAQMGGMTGQWETAMTGLLERADKTQAAMSDQTRKSADELRACLRELANGVHALNGALKKLGEESVVAQLPRRRRGLFGFSRKADNGD